VLPQWSGHTCQVFQLAEACGGGRAAKFSAARPGSPNSKTATNPADRSRELPASLAGEPFAE
jgi:hypothetical protein